MKTKKRISNSENVFGYCEYDSKYLLLDTICKGIYIFDMDSKTKVAVCDINPEFPKNGWNTYYIEYHKNIGKMFKLKDGQVLKFIPSLTIVDIRECIRNEKGHIPPKTYILNGKYFIELSYDNYIKSYQLYD